jgi:hypothetical protein
VKFELREYTIEAGRLDDFVSEWHEQVLPLRLALGFNALGPWVDREASRFVWIVGHDGDLDAADQAYHDSAERRAMSPDPVRLVVEVRTISLEAPSRGR